MTTAAAIIRTTPMATPAGTSLVDVYADGSVVATTVCCSAAVTGTSEGTACKSCYHDAPDWMGVTYPSVFAAAQAAWA